MNARPDIYALETSRPIGMGVDTSFSMQFFQPEGKHFDPSLSEALRYAWEIMECGSQPKNQGAAHWGRSSGLFQTNTSLDFVDEEFTSATTATSEVGGHRAEATTLATAALKRNPSTKHQSELVRFLKLRYWAARDFESLYRIYASHGSMHDLADAASISHLSVDAAIESEQLRFKTAERLARRALSLSSESPTLKNASSLAHCVLAKIAYEAGDVDQADAFLRGQLSAVEHLVSIEGALLAFPVAAFVANASGNDNLANLILQRGEQLGRRLGWARLALQCSSLQASFHVKNAQLGEARDKLARSAEYVSSLVVLNGESRGLWPLTLAKFQLKLVTDSPIELARQIEPHIRKACEQRQHDAEISLRLVRSSALYRIDQYEAADNDLLIALKKGADAGLYRTFIDHFWMIGDSLKRLGKGIEEAGFGYLSSYIQALVADPLHLPVCRNSERLAVALSHKEKAVLCLIRLGLSNKEIAKEMRVAPETVKSHVKRVFIKLASRSRAEAVSKAQDLGII